MVQGKDFTLGFMFRKKKCALAVHSFGRSNCQLEEKQEKSQEGKYTTRQADINNGQHLSPPS